MPNNAPILRDTTETRKLVVQYKSLSKVARLLGVSRQRIWQIIHRDRQIANDAVKYAIRHGRLIRPTICELCLISCKPEAHHEDYTKQLDVQWLCRVCHRTKDHTNRVSAEQWLQKLPTTEVSSLVWGPNNSKY